MFKSLKLFSGQSIDLERLFFDLVAFGYKKQALVAEQGDFASRGLVVDIFPSSFELPIRLELDNDVIVSIKTFNPEKGNLLWQHRIAIILPFQKTPEKKNFEFSEEFPLNNFVDIGVGDYVVHNQHGVGKFLGFEKIKIKDKPVNHLVIEYDLKEKLYVPVESMHLVQKYIAFCSRKPKLYRIGSGQWKRTKERTRRGIQKMAWDLLTLQAMRLAMGGFKFSPDTQWQVDFEKTFPYLETPDQSKAMLDVKSDMESGKPMDRLLCGDVGYGKTEVAMRAAFKAVMDNKQVAYLVPTTILAEQHYQNFSSRLKHFAVNVELLCRFKTPAEQKKIIQSLNDGRVDVIIGTHRLLSDDVVFKDLGLVIVDEEQRFGVKAKEKLKKLKLITDLLVLTATPIPRTLYMSLMGAKDFSVINTPPQNRLPIQTVVVEYDLDLVHQAIRRELNRKGQVFFLHNRIVDLDKVKEKISRGLPPETRIAVAHGQMPAKLLENVMSDFICGKIDVLVSTMIIESGIDIPNANTLIVDGAENFGLSDLHQLRGRVGRFNRNAYAYFMFGGKKILESNALKRLKAIETHSELGSGFKISMEDLEIRGAGNLLGQQQHGFIAAIGFDLYCRLLKEAIGNFKKTGVFDARHN